MMKVDINGNIGNHRQDEERREISNMGVSSDEELTKMIKFQNAYNAYNASSRFINVVNEMIESMITQLGS